jgi:hypothetical protein
MPGYRVYTGVGKHLPPVSGGRIISEHSFPVRTEVIEHNDAILSKEKTLRTPAKGLS